MANSLVDEVAMAIFREHTRASSSKERWETVAPDVRSHWRHLARTAMDIMASKLPLSSADRMNLIAEEAGLFAEDGNRGSS